MASEKQGGRIRHEAGVAQADGGRTFENEAMQGKGIAIVEDPWGSFFEKFWEQSESESIDRLYSRQ